MTPDLLLRLLMTSMGPDDMMAALDPDELIASLSGPVGGTAGRPFGLWGSLMGGLDIPQLSDSEMWQSLFPVLLGLRGHGGQTA